MSAEVFHSPIDTGTNVSAWKNEYSFFSESEYQKSIVFFYLHSSRDSNKTDTTSTKKSGNGLPLDETSQTGQSQMKLMPIWEGGENEDKLIEQQQIRFKKEISFTTTTLDWTPTEYV
jgi:hypothetical protein